MKERGPFEKYHHEPQIIIMNANYPIFILAFWVHLCECVLFVCDKSTIEFHHLLPLIFIQCFGCVEHT